MGRRRAAIALAVLALIATACTGGDKKASEGKIVDADEVTETPVGPQTYTIEMDVPSPEGKQFQSAVFLPINVQVRPGDTIVFENRSTQAPHTVTFGTKESLTPEAPSPMTKAGLANPLVFQPCFSATVPAPDAEACPETAPVSPPAYAGTGFWNSGAVAPGSAVGSINKVAMQLSPEIPQGTYSYSCLLHANMSGLIEVVPTEEERKMPEAVSAQAARQRAAVLKSGGLIAEPAPTDGLSVTAGWGDRTTAVNRFAPAALTVKAGQSVTWKAAHPSEPHTVTFESPFNAAHDPGVFTPGGVKNGGRYSGGLAHSGLMGPAPFSGDTFSLVFTRPGTYSYICVLHPGMAGQVTVTG